MIRYFFLVNIIIIIATKNIFACDCDGIESFETAIKCSDRIFTGHVVSIKPYRERNEKHFKDFVIELKIDTVYKGIRTKNIKLITAVAIGSCGYPFKKAKTYLVYASATNKSFYVSYCSRTKEVKDAKNDIVKLIDLSNY